MTGGKRRTESNETKPAPFFRRRKDPEREFFFQSTKEGFLCVFLIPTVVAETGTNGRIIVLSAAGDRPHRCRRTPSLPYAP